MASQPATLYIGGVNGGVWKTTDGYHLEQPRHAQLRFITRIAVVQTRTLCMSEAAKGCNDPIFLLAMVCINPPGRG